MSLFIFLHNSVISPSVFKPRGFINVFLHTWIFSLRCCTTLRRKYSLDSFFLNICFVNLTLRRLTGINRTQLSSPLSLDSYCSSQKIFHMVKLFSLVISSQCFLQNRSQGVESINRCFCLSCVTFTSPLLALLRPGWKARLGTIGVTAAASMLPLTLGRPPSLSCSIASVTGISSNAIGKSARYLPWFVITIAAVISLNTSTSISSRTSGYIKWNFSVLSSTQVSSCTRKFLFLNFQCIFPFIHRM